MEFAPIDSRVLRIVAIMALPPELVAIFGFYNCPIDVGYPPGTNPLWIAFGITGVLIHYPALMLADRHPLLPELLFIMVSFAIGYIDSFVMALAVGFACRMAKRVISRARLENRTE